MLAFIKTPSRRHQYKWSEAFISLFWRLYPWTIFLAPLSWIFQFLGWLRSVYKKHCLKTKTLGVLTLCVGNVRVGGSGKTPLTILLVQHLCLKDYKVAVVVRPYRALKKLSVPVEVHLQSDVQSVGDEAMILKRRTSALIVSSDSKTEAMNFLHKHYKGMIDVVVFDDGLQDPAVDYDITVALFDDRAHPNALLPLGPLRESWERLVVYDYALRVGYGDHFFSEGLNYAFLKKPLQHAYHHFTNQVHFFDPDDRVVFISSIAYAAPILNRLGDLCQLVGVIECGDHGSLAECEFRTQLGHHNGLILITEKEFVKMQHYLQPSDPVWILRLECELQRDILERLLRDIEKKLYEKKT